MYTSVYGFNVHEIKWRIYVYIRIDMNMQQTRFEYELVESMNGIWKVSGTACTQSYTINMQRVLDI